jgi:chromate transporter
MLGQLALLFGRLSLLAVGGANSTVPEIARQVVTLRQWMSPAQFVQLFAIANAAPGPNVMISTVIGAHVAGFVGGWVATLAMILPAGTLVIIVSRIWDQHRDARWRNILQRALLPITAGLVLAAAGILVRQADTGWLTCAITAVCATLSWRSKLHPLWLMGGGVLFGGIMLS